MLGLDRQARHRSVGSVGARPHERDDGAAQEARLSAINWGTVERKRPRQVGIEGFRRGQGSRTAEAAAATGYAMAAANATAIREGVWQQTLM